MPTKRRGKKETKQEPPTQYRVIDPVSLADLENIHTRKGKYSTKPPPLGQASWEDAKREKEERLRKAKKERPLSTPLETTSTDAMDSEEAQELSREIAAKAAEKESRKQRYAQYQQKRQQTTGYDFPRPVSVTPLEPNKEKESQGARPKIPSSNVSAFQDHTSDMMRALNNPWVPKGRKTTTHHGLRLLHWCTCLHMGPL